ncbi:hypothetical protein COOONC_03914 [Cooperia oncophora]
MNPFDEKQRARNAVRAEIFAIRHPETVAPISEYRDQRFQGTLKEQTLALRTSTTLYIGNLSFYTSEDQLYELFGRAGEVKRVIVGLDRFKKSPCGFCFVIYFARTTGHGRANSKISSETDEILAIYQVSGTSFGVYAVVLAVRVDQSCEPG